MKPFLLLVILIIAKCSVEQEHHQTMTNNETNSTLVPRRSAVEIIQTNAPQYPRNRTQARLIINNKQVIVGEAEEDEDEESQAAPTLQRRVCYFANWAPYRDLSPPLYPDDIDPALCTHIHYAFAKIDLQSLALLPTEEHDMNWTERTNMPLYIRLYGLKRRNMALKILLAVGGWSAKSDGFNLATRSHQNRSRFINQTIKLLREWNFDGVDLGSI